MENVATLICLGSYRIKVICIITYWFIVVIFVGFFMNNILRVHFKFDLGVRISRLRMSFFQLYHVELCFS